MDYRPAGLEGLVAKAADGTYRPARGDWVKVKSRETAESSSEPSREVRPVAHEPHRVPIPKEP